MTQLNPNWIQALTYSARLDRQLIKATFTEGVLSGMKVSQRAAGGAAMFVDIAVGVSVIYGDDQVDQGAYLCSTTVLETIAIGAAPGSNSRRDLIIQRINDPNAGGPAGSTSSFAVVAGTPAASPTLPALPTSAIPLAEVLVTVGNVQVTDAMITGLRVPSYGTSDVPPGVGMPFFGPESAIPANTVLLNGQALNKDTYWRIFYFYGTTYGSAATTFNTPDLRGRVPVGLDNMGGVDAGRLTVAPNTLGATGGLETVALSTANLAAHTHGHAHTHSIDPPNTALSLSDPTHNHSQNSHNHGQDSHNHSQNSHGHTDAGHAHNNASGSIGTGQLLGGGGAVATTGGARTLFDTFGTDSAAANIQGNTATNNATTATNQAATASNNAAATGISGSVDIAPFTSGAASTANTDSTGSGTAHENMPPFLLCNWIARN